MDRLAKIGHYLRWIKGDKKLQNNQQQCNSIESKKFFHILESILLWENSVNSISVVLVFNILFWGIVVLEVRGFAAASSAALVVVLCYSSLEAQVEQDEQHAPTISQTNREQLGKIINRAKLSIQSLKDLRKNQPGTFCAGVCTLSVLLWLIGRAINGVFLTYVICMSVLLGPALLLQVPIKVFSTKEWDSEIEEFLPAVTEDSLEVLERAGETGDQSPTSLDFKNDPFNDDELIGLNMPSHDDASTDGLDLSDHDLSTGNTDAADGIKIKSGHFERSSSSSSSDDIELEPQDSDDDDDDDDDDNYDSESEFEIIDTHEITNIDKV